MSTNLEGTFLCHYCKVLKPRKKRTRDHVVPKSLGGSSHEANLVWACITCNMRKRNDLPTCRCEYCRKAVEHHWNHIRGFHPSNQIALAYRVPGLFEAYGLPPVLDYSWLEN